MATNIPMDTLQKVIYKGTELNALDVALDDEEWCKWRKAYSFTMPNIPIGIDNITITRLGESNCGQLTSLYPSNTGKILYGDTLSLTVTPHDGYGPPTVTFTGSISNRKVTGNVGLQVTAGGPSAWQTVWSDSKEFGGGADSSPGDHAKTVTIRVAGLGLGGGTLSTAYPIRVSGTYKSGTYTSTFSEVELSATYVTLGSNETGSGTSADPSYWHSVNALARQDSSSTMFADYEIVLDIGTTRRPLVTGNWTSIYPSIILTKIEQLMPLDPDDFTIEETLITTFPAISENTTYTTIVGANNRYIYTARATREYTGYSQYSTCTIEGVQLGTYLTDLSLPNDMVLSGTTRKASFHSGKLTTCTEQVITSPSALQSPGFGVPSATGIATFSGFGGCTVRLPVKPTGVTNINYVYTDFTNQANDIDASASSQQTITVPWNYSVAAAVTCANWAARNGSYGPWTITEDTILPSPSIKFNAGPTQTNSTVTTTQVTLYYRNNTGIPVNITVQAYKGSTFVETYPISNLSPGSTATAWFMGFLPSTTYTFRAYYTDPAGKIVTNTSEATVTTITTSSSGSQPS